ncbi:MAG: hypothetical protein ACI957_001459 [Verrucomicrobiales bacterium]
MCGSEGFGFVDLRVAGGKGGDFAALGVEELQREVSETANADDGDMIERGDGILHDGIEDGDATAEEWTLTPQDRVSLGWACTRGLERAPCRRSHRGD